MMSMELKHNGVEVPGFGIGCAMREFIMAFISAREAEGLYFNTRARLEETCVPEKSQWWFRIMVVSSFIRAGVLAVCSVLFCSVL
jgi:hypothetical protein